MHYWLSGSLQARGQSEVEADVHAQEAVLLAFQHVDRNQVSACLIEFLTIPVSCSMTSFVSPCLHIRGALINPSINQLSNHFLLYSYFNSSGPAAEFQRVQKLVRVVSAEQLLPSGTICCCSTTAC